MYQIYADDTLIYDSTIEDYKIVKGSITLETNKSGSFSFAIYPDHFYYDNFVRLKTVITVYKSGKIVFRGRILNDVTDYYNNKVLTCEGELGFLQDSIIRPFAFNGTPREFFERFILEHNSQVDDFKKFKIGDVTVVDPNNYISRSNSNYESALSNLNSRLIGDSLGGYFYITHGEDGTDIIPTINYLADFTNVSSQKIEFGSNLKNYTKTVNAEAIATAIIPLGAEVDDGDDDTENPKLTITSVNGGKDYVYSEEGVALYGWITKVVEWGDVTNASNLKRKAEEYLKDSINQNVTIELNAIDLHLLDKSIESFKVGDYIHVVSEPHNFDSILLCNKQTIDLLKPENDSVVLGYTYAVFSESHNTSYEATISKLNDNSSELKNKVSKIEVISCINTSMEEATINASKINLNGVVTANNQFKINIDGSMETNNGKFNGIITGSEIVSERVVTKYATDYTEEDSDRVQQIILRTIEPTDEDYDKYDLNGDGIINGSDLVRIRRFLNGTDESYSFNNYIKISSGYDNALLKTEGVSISRGAVRADNSSIKNLFVHQINTKKIDDSTIYNGNNATVTVTIPGGTCDLIIVNGLIVGLNYNYN